MAANILQDFGNNLGYVYITEADGTTILNNIVNDTSGVQVVKSDALISAPLAGNISAYGIIVFGGVDANVTGLTVNGISIISGAVVATGAITTTVQAVRDNINAYTSVPDYTAVSIGTTLYIIANPAAGSAPNGYAIATLTTMTTAITNMYGGTNTTGVYDEITGHRYFLNADYDASGCSGAVPAVEGDLTNAVEISNYVINRGFQTSLPSELTSVLDNQLTVPRISCITVLGVDTEGSAATDDLYVIDPTNFNIGDILIMRAQNFAQQTTVKQAVGPSDNIQLANATDFTLGLSTRVIALELVSLAGTLTWSEIFRSPNIDISVTTVRAAGIALPQQGVFDNALTLAAQIITLTPGSSPEYQRITGSGALTGNVSVVFAGTPEDGDHFYIDYDATITLGAFNIVIGSITLTSTQALQAGYMVYCYYELATLTWHCQIWKDTVGEDLVDTIQLATKENDLGLPAADGYFLTSTTTGTRSWIPQQQHILYDVVANNATTAVTTRENLKTYTLPAGTLNVNGSTTGGSQIIVEAVFQTAANNDAKTFGVSFGATDLISYTATGADANNKTIYIRATVNRVTQVAQSSLATVMNDSVHFSCSYTTPVENLGGAVNIYAFGTNGVATANDIISRSMTVTII